MTECDMNDRFNRVERLVGREGLEALERSRVIVFGIGGVGSWTAEALVRSGIGSVTMVDADRVAESNINRQLPATTATVGESKVEVMCRRLREINPEAEVTGLQMRYDAESADSFDLDSYDYVVDAIDSLADKALLIVRATSSRARLVSSMGAALKLDPTKVSVAEFWKVKGCPLGAALRRRFKRSGEFPKRKFKCVYSEELLKNRGVAEDGSGAMTYDKVAVNGAMCHITGVFGLMLCGLIVEDIVKRAQE